MIESDCHHARTDNRVDFEEGCDLELIPFVKPKKQKYYKTIADKIKTIVIGHSLDKVSRIR